MVPFLARGQNDPSIFNIRIEGVAWPKTEPTPQRAGKNDLAFGRDLGLHGKTILPRIEAQTKSGRRRSRCGVRATQESVRQTLLCRLLHWLFLPVFTPAF